MLLAGDAPAGSFPFWGGVEIFGGVEIMGMGS